MRSLWLMAAVLWVGACSAEEASPPEAEGALLPTPEPAATSSGPASVDGISITSVGDLLGEYRVAGIDGEALNAPIGIAVSIDGPTLSYEPTCAGFVWLLRFEGARLVTTRFSEAPSDPQGPPPPVCAVAVLPEQRQLAQALDAADSVRRTPANGIEFSGGGRSVLLFSQ